jgi:hypothetical protein
MIDIEVSYLKPFWPELGDAQTKVIDVLSVSEIVG